MLRKLLTASALVCLAGAASGAGAPQDETRIRQDSQNTQVISVRNGPLCFTVTGAASDMIETPFYNGPLGSAPGILEVIRHSGGQCSFRFVVPSNPAWNGSVIRLFRNGRFIDGDRVVCR
ncbi:MAG: hypothetical protein K1X67_09405 [Fimbriimonadaceae bacterium]|nr:hypothetical protein [Fimbriimonadaceae bacterium]